MHRRAKRLVAAVLLLAALTVTPMIALAASYIDIPLNHSPSGPGTGGYDGDNNWQTTGTGYESLQATGTNHYLASANQIYWSQASIDWIRASTQANRYQPAIVYHATNRSGSNCGHGYYESYWTDLPGNWGFHKPGAVGCDDNEMRIGVGLPWSMAAYQYYTAQATWVDQSNFAGELDIDNYWLDTQPPAWNPGGVIIRDNQGKLCFNQNSVSQPGGSNFSCP